MPIGQPAIPVPSDSPLNNPVTQAVVDEQKSIEGRLTVLERAGDTTTEMLRQIKWLYDNLPGGPFTYPPP